uniref:Protein kinase domain-containing protein n=1 Tax=Oryzias latipes TaxID=8090 RepID=A0A3P9M249_ORYLA
MAVVSEHSHPGYVPPTLHSTSPKINLLMKALCARRQLPRRPPISSTALLPSQLVGSLKSISVTHCDIKLDNIMFAEPDSANVKLIDFGLAVETKKLSTGTEIQITPFRAPEVILGLPLDESVDMWALGVVLASVYFGNYPFPFDTEYETIRAMVQIFGLPEAEVLHKAKYRAPFFTRDNGDWRLRTPEEYTESTGEQVEKDHDPWWPEVTTTDPGRRGERHFVARDRKGRSEGHIVGTLNGET